MLYKVLESSNSCANRLAHGQVGYLDYKSSGVEEGYVQTSLGRIRFIHKPGKGGTLLLLHGVGATVQTWNRFLQRIELDAYAIDLLGHGESDRPHINYTVDAQVAVVREFIGKKGIGKPFIMGNSYGGWIALEYALRNSVPGLVIEDGAVLNEYDSDMINDASKEELLRAVLGENDNDRTVMKSIIDTYTGMRPESIAKVAAPTLILWGGQDDIISVRAGDRLRTLIKGSTLIIIKRAGHVPHFSNAEETARDVTRFVNGAGNEGKDSFKGQL